ncbi:MAG: tellurium resistance protein [Gemmobacter sp.]|nr:tellurium resistance protein [Gemmobacter sp.]
MADPKPFRPKQFPPPEFPPRRPALFARMPPAVFPAIMGLLGLGLGLRRGMEYLGLPPGLAEMLLGATVALWAFAAFGYAVKLARRPGVLLEDMRILPGRAGLSAAVLGALLSAAALVPYSAAAAWGLLLAGLVLQAGLAVLVLRLFFTAPAEAREITPVWHLHFVGFIIGALAAVPLGADLLGRVILFATLPVAGAIWLASALQLIRRIPPAPLRPLLAIHLAPASLLATVAASLGLPQLGLGLLALAAVIFLGLLACLRWLTQSGFSALWGAFTFPLAAFVSALYANGFGTTATILLLASLAIIPAIAWKVCTAWAKGSLAAKTNAAEA